MFSKTPSNSFGKMHLVACCSRHRESISIKASELWDDALNVVQLDDVFMVGICRIDNEYTAYGLVCPHHGANLGESSYDARTISPSMSEMGKARKACQFLSLYGLSFFAEYHPDSDLK